MADKKISALTASTTPLAGTEVLPIVQGGATVKVSVANLTAGRAVSASSLTASTDNVIIGTTAKGITTGSAIPLGFGVNNSTTDMTLDTSGNLLVGNTTQILYVNKELNVNAASGSAGFAIATGGVARLYMTGGSTNGNITTKGAIPLLFGTDETERMRITAAGDVTVGTGNVVIGTAAKGIDFSANTHAAGMTSELLNDYEEGTWTPDQGGGLTVVGAFSSSGKYTRIGRQITVTGQVNGATSVLVSASGIISTNLPYASGIDTLGGATNSALSVVGGVFVSTGSANLFATIAIGATPTIYFQVTYFV
jgi:hypothetical protein